MGNVLKRYNGTSWEAVGGTITGDTLPIGSEVDYTGTDIPAGWEVVDSYSTSEVNTGQTWIDGKPIYRKVIDITDTKTAQAAYSKQIDLSSLNIDTLVKTDYTFWHGNTNWAAVNVETSNYYMSSSDYCRLYRTKTSTSDRYNFSCFVNEQNVRLIIIIEYTKTTD